MSYGEKIGNCLVESSKQLHTHYIDVLIEIEPEKYTPVIKGDITECFYKEEVKQIEDSEDMFQTIVDILVDQYPYLMKDFKTQSLGMESNNIASIASKASENSSLKDAITSLSPKSNTPKIN